MKRIFLKAGLTILVLFWGFSGVATESVRDALVGPAEIPRVDAIQSQGNSFLQTIPVQVSTGVMVLVGILISNFIIFVQFRGKIRHEFQKDIYMEAAEKIAIVTATILSLPSKKSEDVLKDSEKLSGMGGVSNKIAMVGSEETIRSMARFSEVSTGLVLDIFERLVVKISHESKANSLSRNIESNLENQRKLTTELAAMNEAEYKGPRGEFVREEYEKLSRNFNKMMSERTAAWIEINRIQNETMKATIERYDEISDSLVEANINIRRELKFKLNEENFRKIMKKNFTIGKERMKTFMTEMERHSHF